MLTSKRVHIQQLLGDVDDKLREVNLNFANVEEKIYQMLKEALMQLQVSGRPQSRSEWKQMWPYSGQSGQA